MQRLAADKLPKSRIMISGPFGDSGASAKTFIQRRREGYDLAGGIVERYALEVFTLPEPIDQALQAFVAPFVEELFDALL